MKKGKPIEPGCLAMIVGSKYTPENNGRVVRVVRKMGKYESFVPPEVTSKPLPNPENATLVRWLVEATRRPLVWKARNRRNDCLQTFDVQQRGVAERCLIRLDDDEEPKQETRVAETHKPKTEEVF